MRIRVGTKFVIIIYCKYHQRVNWPEKLKIHMAHYPIYKVLEWLKGRLYYSATVHTVPHERPTVTIVTSDVSNSKNCTSSAFCLGAANAIALLDSGS